MNTFKQATTIMMVCAGMASALHAAERLPNIIMCMADDMGWGDTGYNGNKIIQTPALDEMAAKGLTFSRFYSTSATCTPTRFGLLTGRHPGRCNVGVNVGHMADEEVTLAELLKEQGYATAHYGKWHLGVLSRNTVDGHRGGLKHHHPDYMVPTMQGYDEYLVTERAVPTYDPMKIPVNPKIDREAILAEGERAQPGDKFKWPKWEHGAGSSWAELKEGEAFQHSNTHYWKGDEEIETQNLDGCDSRVIMDRTLDFIERAVAKDQPFMIQVWFHTPHTPLVASEESQALYKDYKLNEQAYYGSITAMDTQMGRLRKKLKELGVAENTMLWFTSDNGASHPEKAPGSVLDLRGGKASLWEGGIRVPGLLEWPAKIKEARVTDVPFVTSDLLSTSMAALGYGVEGYPIDGLNMLPLIEGQMNKRPKPVFFSRTGSYAIHQDRYKLMYDRKKDRWSLYDMVKDRSETTDVAAQYPEVVATLKAQCLEWAKTLKPSKSGADYPIQYQLVPLTP